jgi:hypothetical protein
MFTLIEKWLNFVDYDPKFGSFDPFKLFFMKEVFIYSIVRIKMIQLQYGFA